MLPKRLLILIFMVFALSACMSGTETVAPVVNGWQRAQATHGTISLRHMKFMMVRNYSYHHHEYEQPVVRASHNLMKKRQSLSHKLSL